MYPIITISDIISIHTFGVMILFSGFLFFYLLHTLSLRKGIVQHIFSDLLAFILTPFIFWRVFHIVAEWREQKFLFMDLVEWDGFFNFLRNFFLTENYNLSLVGCIAGFFLVFFIKTRKNKAERPIYYDILIPAFLGSALLGYFGAFLGWQVYGIPYSGLFSLSYNTKESIVPFRNTLFPLPFLYIICLLLIGLYLYRIYKKWHSLPNGFIGYMGFWLYGIVLFLVEFLNGSSDMLGSSFIGINMNQALGLFFIAFAFIWLGKSLKLENL